MSGQRLVVALLAAVLSVPAGAQPKPPAPKPAAAQAPVAAAGEPDIAYSEYQRGNYVAAFKEATRRVEEKSDPKAMTLLGELYAEGLAVANNDKKAADWYKLAAARGDPRRRSRWPCSGWPDVAAPSTGRRRRASWPRPPKLGHAVAAYDLALLHLEGQIVRPDLARAAELMRMAADAGNPQAQYALATFYKEGRGVTKDLGEAARLLGLAARSGHTDSEIEYAIALFNGTGIAKNESAAAGYFLKAAQKNNPVAQDRLAWMYATGRGIKAEPVEAARWHLTRKAGGIDDQPLDELIRNMKPTDRAMGENKAKPRIARMNSVGPTRSRRRLPVPSSRSRSSLDGRCGVGASAMLQADRETSQHDGPVMARSAAATFGRAW